MLKKKLKLSESESEHTGEHTNTVVGLGYELVFDVTGGCPRIWNRFICWSFDRHSIC